MSGPLALRLALVELGQPKKEEDEVGLGSRHRHDTVAVDLFWVGLDDGDRNIFGER